MAHMQHVTYRNLEVFPFFVDPFIHNVLSLKPCVQISNRFHRWIPRVEIFKTRSHVDRFWQTFFTKKPNREHGFFPFPKEACPCLSRNHNHAYRGSKTATLAEKKRKRVFYRFRGGTAVTLKKIMKCVSNNIHNFILLPSFVLSFIHIYVLTPFFKLDVADAGWTPTTRSHKSNWRGIGGILSWPRHQ